VRICEGSDLTMVTYGTTINSVLRAAETLQKEGIHVEVIKLNRISPLDGSLLIKYG